jgi:exodeoxyribonuclease VII small subunit
VTTPTTPATPATQAEPPIASLGFDEALDELKRTVAELEAGGQPLEQALARHERAAALLGRCEELLNQAQLRVAQLVSQAGSLRAVDVRPEDAADPDEASSGAG